MKLNGFKIVLKQNESIFSSKEKQKVKRKSLSKKQKDLCEDRGEKQREPAEAVEGLECLHGEGISN